MYFLESICEMSSLDPVWNILGFIVKAIWIGVPILLVIYGMLDLGKAVIAGKEDEMKKATGTLIKRVLYAIAVFLVVTIVSFVMGLVGSTEWKQCWNNVGNANNSNLVEE